MKVGDRVKVIIEGTIKGVGKELVDVEFLSTFGGFTRKFSLVFHKDEVEVVSPDPDKQKLDCQNYERRNYV